eukprot:gnl/MRDRNA2_/MRDRNA2_141322_c0_seq1.p1 gnl/MRDRNA2_/MRDRNA2_141322_c0~~gnl/MRDRNA2_/MRDRNA2_141322_c0_seq1.p1  ORF type:complete len:273 (-),score=27.24 gnl/MRDRNA2_/MRDRNA2_141322_c0_seq1:302-1120(-)
MQFTSIESMQSSPIAWYDEHIERSTSLDDSVEIVDQQELVESRAYVQQSLQSQSRRASRQNVSWRLQMDWIRSVGRSFQQSARIQTLATEIIGNAMLRDSRNSRSQPSASGIRGQTSNAFQSHRHQIGQTSRQTVSHSQRRAQQHRQRTWASINQGLEDQHQERLQQLRDMAMDYQPPDDIEVKPCLISDAIFEELKEEVVSENMLQLHAPHEHSVMPLEGCGICLETYRQYQHRKELPCGHRFHRDCLRSWFQRKPTCPTCRFDCYCHFES